MLRCDHCTGFVPAAVHACPNCDEPLRVPWWRHPSATRGALAGTAAMTLMACYGAPMDWLLTESDTSESKLLDPDNPTTEGSIEFTVNQAALSEAVDDDATVTLTLTPLAAGTEVLLSSTLNGGTAMEETYTASDTAAIVISLPADSFADCTMPVCTQTVSYSLTLNSGRATFEGEASINVFGGDQTMPEDAEVTVTWTP